LRSGQAIWALLKDDIDDNAVCTDEDDTPGTTREDDEDERTAYQIKGLSTTRLSVQKLKKAVVAVAGQQRMNSQPWAFLRALAFPAYKLILAAAMPKKTCMLRCGRS
jgi:hypothetical protein